MEPPLPQDWKGFAAVSAPALRESHTIVGIRLLKDWKRGKFVRGTRNLLLEGQICAACLNNTSALTALTKGGRILAADL